MLKSDDGQEADDLYEGLARRPCNFERWETADLAPSRFQAEGFAARPLILPLPKDGWPAVGRWNANYLTRVAGDGVVRPLVEGGTAGWRSEGLEMTLSEYISNEMAVAATRLLPDAELDGADQNATYVFMQTGFDESDGLGALREDIAAPTFLHEALNETDLYLMLGGRSTGLSFHDHSASWLAMVAGTKFWMVFPPKAFGRVESEMRELGLLPLRDDLGRGEGTARWLWRMLARGDDAASGFIAEGFECLQQPGTVVFLPPGWWHAVINLETFTAAVGGQPSRPDPHAEQAATPGAGLWRYKTFRSAAEGSGRRSEL